MHADVIIVGHDCEAYVLAYLFSRRGFRTLLISPERESQDRFVCIEQELAAKLKPINPPDEAIIQRSVSIDLWSANEKHVVVVNQLPYLVVEANRFRRFIALHSEASRNLKVLKGHSPVRVFKQRGVVTGIGLATGEQLNTRLLIECDAGNVALMHQTADQARFPEMTAHRRTVYVERRSVGTAASAWQHGRISLHLVPGRHCIQKYRYGTDEIELAITPGGSAPTRAESMAKKFFREAGLDQAPIASSYNARPHFASPLPVPCSPGYLAAGIAAGQSNPFYPFDISPAIRGAHLAFVAASHALEEGDLSLRELWEYPRAHARQWAVGQAFTAKMMAGIQSLSEKQFDTMLASGLIDTYALSCLFRNRPLEEEFLDRFARVSRALFQPSTLAAWHAMLKSGRRLARAYDSVPHAFSESSAWNWHQSVVDTW